MKTKLVLVNILLAALLLAGCAPKTKDFRSEAGKFSVKAPVTLEEQPQTINVSGGKVEAHTYLGEKDDIAYVVAYSDYRQEVVNQSTLDEMLNNARDSMISSANGKLILETRISLGDTVGREFTLDYEMLDGNDGTMKARIYLVKNRLYQVMVLADKANADAASITKFLDSFKLLGDQ